MLILDTLPHLTDSATIHTITNVVVPAIESQFPIVKVAIGIVLGLTEILPRFIPTANSYSPFRLLLRILDYVCADQKKGGGVH